MVTAQLLGAPLDHTHANNWASTLQYTHHFVTAAHKNCDCPAVGRPLDQQHAVARGAEAQLTHALGKAQLLGRQLLRKETNRGVGWGQHMFAAVGTAQVFR